VNLRPISAVSALAGPTITPSLIMSTTLFVPNNSSSHLPYRSTSRLNVWKLYQESGGIKIMNKILAAPLWLIILARFVGAQSLDYQTYKTTVEPIFLKKRPAHARCVVCHASANHPFRLEPLDKGATTWTDVQSRKNFETVSHLVKPGEPLSSPLLIQPLAHSAGGAEFHSGGRQFASQDDPDWRAIAAWVKAAH
jgi:hypothetical protein